MATRDLTPAFVQTIYKHYYIELDAYQPYRDRIFHTGEMSQRFLDEQIWENYPLPGVRTPGDPIKQAQFRPSFSKRYVPSYYALGDTVADEDVRDDLYAVIHRMLPSKGGGFARMFNVNAEVVAADWLATYGYSSGSTLFGMSDGVSLFNTAHPISASNVAKTVPNRPSVDADLSIATYHMARANLVQQLAPNGIEIMYDVPNKLVVNPYLHQIALQILHGEDERGTSDSNVNVIVQDKVECVEWPYFTSAGTQGSQVAGQWNSWLILGKNHSLTFLWSIHFRMQGDFDVYTNVHVFTGTEAFSVGATDWRGTYGSLGI